MNIAKGPTLHMGDVKWPNRWLALLRSFVSEDKLLYIVGNRDFYENSS